MYLRDSIEIDVPPERVFDWLMHFVENYRSWHPAHGECRWIRGKPFEIGSVLYAEEYLHDELHKLKFKMTKIVPNKGCKFRLLFPVSIIVPNGEFEVEPTETGSRFTATLYSRFGRLLSVFAKKEMKALEQHMREESINLRRLLEKGE